mmetsp:Transcript_21106/g.29813  ORF Transcript_21106/g.29813 Transcript_21106/m.29813 type:complete len:561 (+) Transcript_21106:613-2295(+)
MAYKSANKDIPRSLEIINQLWSMLLSRFEIRSSSIESKLKYRLTEEQSGKFVIPESDIILNPTLVMDGMYQIEGKISSLTIQWTWSFSATSSDTIDNCEDLCLGILLDIQSCKISFVPVSIDHIKLQDSHLISEAPPSGMIEVDMIVVDRVECSVDENVLRGPLGVQICRYLWGMEYLRPLCHHSPLMMATEIYAMNPQRNAYHYRATDVARMDDFYWKCRSLSLGTLGATGVRMIPYHDTLLLFPSQVSFWDVPLWPILRQDGPIDNVEIQLSARHVQVKCDIIRLRIGKFFKKSAHGNCSQTSLGWDTFWLSAKTIIVQCNKTFWYISSPLLAIRRATRATSQVGVQYSTHLSFNAANFRIPFLINIFNLKLVTTKCLEGKDLENFDLKNFRLSAASVALLSKNPKMFRPMAKENDTDWMEHTELSFGTVSPLRITFRTGSKETLPEYHCKANSNLETILNDYLRLIQSHVLAREIAPQDSKLVTASSAVSSLERGQELRTLVWRISFTAVASILISPIVSLGRVCLGGLQHARYKFRDLVRGIFVGKNSRNNPSCDS